jgi:uncharacterized membrane protein
MRHEQKIGLEKHSLSVMKAFSWRVLATLTTMIISYAVTRKLEYAITIGSIEVFVKLFLYYFHERMWVFFKCH